MKPPPSSEPQLDVLIAGAGAVGQVYGAHFARGGARVGYFVRPGKEAQVGTSKKLWRIEGRRRIPVELPIAAVSSSPAEAAAAPWAQLWLCVPATALTSPEIEGLLDAFAGRAIVTTTPGLHDRALIEARVGTEVAAVMTAYAAWFGPLSAADVGGPDEVHYWFPPMAPSKAEGPAHIVDPAVGVLLRGGLPIEQDPHAPAVSAAASAASMPLLGALEASGWSFEACRKSGRLTVAAAAAREAMAAVAAVRESSRPPWAILMRAPILGAALWGLPRLAPIDIEAFIKLHFTKVGEQTRAMLATYARDAEAAHLPNTSLREVLGWLGHGA